ncbi:MAG: ribonuclease J, partial [Oscillospiraceae bacterium]
MASKLKIIPLGGLNEIGKNLTVYEYGDDIIVVDCGLGFPDEEMYGVDIVIPDFSYLVQNQNKIRAIILTHGHEDHIGGLPYLMREINVPLYTTRLTAGLIELKLEEVGLKEKVKITTLEAGERFKAGCFNIELIHVNHSIADSVALAIKTPIGTLIHTGDYKIDATPIEGEMIDLTRLGELGKEGVLMLLSDST